MSDLSREIRKRIRGTGRLVRQLMKDDEQCRNCDKYLMYRVFAKALEQDDNGQVILTLDNIGRLPSPETIIRTRAKIQNVEGVLLPTDPDVRKRRGISEAVYRAWAQTTF